MVNFPDADGVTNQKLLELPCDVLVPAALENQITESDADAITAEVSAKGANDPTTPAAAYILCNAGEVTVSYFEWVQELQYFFWIEDEVNARLQQIMINSFAEILSLSQERAVDMRIAAFIRAIDRVVRAIMVRGIYP